MGLQKTTPESKTAPARPPSHLTPRQARMLGFLAEGKVSMGIEIAHALACALGVKLSELVRKAE
jgi:hypothetical protein